MYSHQKTDRSAHNNNCIRAVEQAENRTFWRNNKYVKKEGSKPQQIQSVWKWSNRKDFDVMAKLSDLKVPKEAEKIMFMVEEIAEYFAKANETASTRSSPYDDHYAAIMSKMQEIVPLLGTLGPPSIADYIKVTGLHPHQRKGGIFTRPCLAKPISLLVKLKMGCGGHTWRSAHLGSNYQKSSNPRRLCVSRTTQWL